MARKSRKTGDLTDQQRLFVSEYLRDKCGKQAAIRAGYSVRSAESTASKLVRHPKVAAAIEAGMARMEKRNENLAQRVLDELARIAFSDLRQHFTPDGKLLPPHKLPDDAAAAVSSIESEERHDRETEAPYTVRKIRLWDKLAALDKLGRHLGLLTEQVQVSGQLTLEQLVLGSMQKDDDGEKGGE